MKKIIFLSLLTSALFAGSDYDTTKFIVDADVKSIDNELGYGKKSNYSLLFAKHSFTADEANLHFYYGAKMGLVSEAYESENGFGIPLKEMRTYFAAAVGMEYDFTEEGVLLAEGIHAEDPSLRQVENKLQLTYTYSY